MFHQDPQYPHLRQPATSYRTYQIISPIATHYRDGTCDEAGCLARQKGWKTVVDEATVLGQRQAHYIRRQSGRRFAESRTEAGLTEFVFESGQTCFARHKVPLDRPEFYQVGSGHYRGRPMGNVRRHSGPDAWVNDFGEHQDRLKRAIEG